MPAVHGRSSAVFLNAYNVSAFLSSFDSTKTVDTAEVTTFGSTSKAYVTGLRDGTITLGGYFDGGAGALDEIMGQVLSDTQVSYGTDLITTGDAAANYTDVTAVSDAGTAINGFTNSIFYGSNAAIRYAYKPATFVLGSLYRYSIYIEMDDTFAPAPGTSSAGDFRIVLNNAAASTLTNCTVELVTGSIYRVSVLWLSNVSGSAPYNGIEKFTTNTARSFRIAGMAITAVTTAAAPNPILSICEDGAGAIGNRCTVAQVIDTSYQITGSISDAVQVTAEFQADGTGVSGAYRGVVLAPLAAYSNGQNTTGFDGGAASSNGLVANLHVLSAGGSTTVKIQHSTDNSSWTDLITFTTGAVQFSEHKTTTGTVHRYLRVNVVTDGLPVIIVTAARK